MGTLTVECETGKISDGYHTFDELYEHRCLLFILLMQCNPGRSWRSWQHSDGSMFDGWFIAGMSIPTPNGEKQVTYHLPVRLAELLYGKSIKVLDKAPEWDGHTPGDVVERLAGWAKVRRDSEWDYSISSK